MNVLVRLLEVKFDFVDLLRETGMLISRIIASMVKGAVSSDFANRIQQCQSRFKSLYDKFELTVLLETRKTIKETRIDMIRKGPWK
jgi:hypothetical protein